MLRDRAAREPCTTTGGGPGGRTSPDAHAGRRSGSGHPARHRGDAGAPRPRHPGVPTGTPGRRRPDEIHAGRSPDTTRSAPRPAVRRAAPAPVRTPSRAGDRDGLEGPAPPVGARLSPDVLVPCQLPGGARPRLRRPLHATRRRRPGPLLRPRHDPAAGVRRGSDRRRQRPEPAGPRPDRGQGRTARRAQLEARLAGLRLAWSFESTAWLELAERVAAGSPEAVPAAGSGAGPGSGTELVPPEVALAFHPRTLAQLLFVRGRLRLAETDGPVPGGGAGRDPPRQATGLPLRGDAQHLQHGPALRPRRCRADRLRFAGARPLRPAGRQAGPHGP